MANVAFTVGDPVPTTTHLPEGSLYQRTGVGELYQYSGAAWKKLAFSSEVSALTLAGDATGPIASNIVVRATADTFPFRNAATATKLTLDWTSQSHTLTVVGSPFSFTSDANVRFAPTALAPIITQDQRTDNLPGQNSLFVAQASKVGSGSAGGNAIVAGGEGDGAGPQGAAALQGGSVVLQARSYGAVQALANLVQFLDPTATVPKLTLDWTSQSFSDGVSTWTTTGLVTVAANIVDFTFTQARATANNPNPNSPGNANDLSFITQAPKVGSNNNSGSFYIETAPGDGTGGPGDVFLGPGAHEYFIFAPNGKLQFGPTFPLPSVYQSQAAVNGKGTTFTVGAQPSKAGSGSDGGDLLIHTGDGDGAGVAGTGSLAAGSGNILRWNKFGAAIGNNAVSPGHPLYIERPASASGWAALRIADAGGIGALSVHVNGADNSGIYFDGSIESTNVIAKDPVVLRLRKVGGFFSFAGTSGQTVGGVVSTSPPNGLVSRITFDVRSPALSRISFTANTTNPVFSIEQATASGKGTTLNIVGQAAFAASNSDGGDVVVQTGAGDGTGSAGTGFLKAGTVVTGTWNKNGLALGLNGDVSPDTPLYINTASSAPLFGHAVVQAGGLGAIMLRVNSADNSSIYFDATLVPTISGPNNTDIIAQSSTFFRISKRFGALFIAASGGHTVGDRSNTMLNTIRFAALPTGNTGAVGTGMNAGTGMLFTGSANTPIYGHEQKTVAGKADTLSVIAQQAATGLNGDGGDLKLQTGIPDGSGVAGDFYIYAGAVQRMKLDQQGVLTLGHYGSGVALFSSAGVVSSSGIGTDGQVLTLSGGVPSWASISSGSVTLSGDVTGAASANTAVGLTGTSNAVAIHNANLVWDAVSTNTTIKQTDAPSGTGQALTIQAQNAAAAGQTGGALTLKTGAPGSGGVPGSYLFNFGAGLGVTWAWNGGAMNWSLGATTTAFQVLANTGTNQQFLIRVGGTTPQGIFLDSDKTFFRTGVGASALEVDTSATGNTQVVFAPATSPVITQAQATSDVIHDFTISSQAPFATATVNKNPGNLVLSIPAPIAGGVAGFVKATMSGNQAVAIGLYPGFPTGGTIWMGQITPSAANYALVSDGNTLTALNVASPSGSIALSVNNATVMEMFSDHLEFAQVLTAPKLIQATRVGDNATHDLTISSQAPFASATTNKNPGNLVFSIPAPIAGGAAGFVKVTTSANQAVSLGTYPADATFGAVWLGNITPSSTNYAIASNGTTTNVNAATGSVVLDVGDVNQISIHVGETVAGDGKNGWNFYPNFSSPKFGQHTQTSDIATHDLTMSSQAPLATATTNKNPGNLVFSVPSPVAGGVDGFHVFQVSGITRMRISSWVGTGTPANQSAVYLGPDTPANSNYVVLSDGQSLLLNAPGGTGHGLTGNPPSVQFALANISQVHIRAGRLDFSVGLPENDPIISQRQRAVSGKGRTFSLIAQASQAGSGSDGGDLVLSGGAGDGVGAAGFVRVVAAGVAGAGIAQFDASKNILSGPLNLAGGGTYVTGTLPVGNLPNLAGDVTGALTSSVVVGITGTSGTAHVHATSLVWDAGVTLPAIQQAQATVTGTGQKFGLYAQDAKAGSGSDGGVLELGGGLGDTGGGDGNNGRIRFRNYTAGVALVLSGGDVISSLISDAYVSAISWSKITGTPTTLSAYGITDAVPSSRALTGAGAIQISGNNSPHALSADLTISVVDATTGQKGVVELAQDLGGTATAPTVTALTGAIGAVSIRSSASILLFDPAAPYVLGLLGIGQNTTSGNSVVGKTFTVAAQTVTSGTGTVGGHLFLTSGNAVTPGDVQFAVGTTLKLSLTKNGSDHLLLWDPAVTFPSIGQHAAASGSGTSFSLFAQDGLQSGNTNGGDFSISTGSGHGTGTDGRLFLQVGGTTIVSVFANGLLFSPDQGIIITQDNSTGGSGRDLTLTAQAGEQTTNTDGGAIGLTGGAGHGTGVGGGVRLFLADATSPTANRMLELTWVNGQRILALCKGSALTTTDVPPNTIDRALFIGNISGSDTGIGIPAATGHIYGSVGGMPYWKLHNGGLGRILEWEMGLAGSAGVGSVAVPVQAVQFLTMFVDGTRYKLALYHD